jgi:hypothetical protein
MIAALVAKSFVRNHGTVCAPSLTILLESQFQERICPAKWRRQPGHPVLSVDGLSGAGILFWRQYPRHSWKSRPGHFPAYGARSYSHLRIITNAFGLAHVAARHHVQPVSLFPEPYGSGDGDAVFSKRGQGYVFLAANFGWDGLGHDVIVRLARKSHEGEDALSAVVRSISGALIPPSLLC